MKKHCLKLFSLAIIIMIALYGVVVCDASETNTYSIENATFDIEILSNGNVNVTEKWEVKYNGSHKGFTKSFMPYDLGNAEEYSDITLNWATINDVKCSLANSLDTKEDYKIFVENHMYPYGKGPRVSHSTYIFNWIHNINNETVIFKVNYTVKDLTKLLKQDDKYVCVTRFRPICKDFKDEVDLVRVNVVVPNKSEIVSFDSNKQMRYGIEDGCILSAEKDNNKKLLQISIMSTPNGFNNELDKINSLSSMEYYINDVEDVGPLVVLFDDVFQNFSIASICTIGIILIVFNIAVVLIKHVYSKLKPDIKDEFLANLKKHHDSSLLALSLSDYTYRHHFIIIVLIRDLMNRGIIVDGIDGVGFNEDKINELSNDEAYIIYQIKEHIENLETNPSLVVNLNRLCYTYLDVICGEVTTKLSKKDYIMLRYGALFLAKYALNEYTIVSTMNLSEHLSDKIDYNDLAMLALIYYSPKSRDYVNTVLGNQWFNVIDNYSANYNTVYDFYYSLFKRNISVINLSKSYIKGCTLNPIVDINKL